MALARAICFKDDWKLARQEQYAFEKTPYRDQRLLLGQCPLDSQTVLQLALVADDDFILWR